MNSNFLIPGFGKGTLPFKTQQACHFMNWKEKNDGSC